MADQKEAESASSGKGNVLKELQQAVKGLLYPSEADKPVKAVFWSKDEVGADSVDADVARKLQKVGADEPVETMSLQEFIDSVMATASWDEEHKTNAERFQDLQHLLEGRLKEVQVYRIGNATAQLLLVGKTEAGDVAGLTTQVVET